MGKDYDELPRSKKGQTKVKSDDDNDNNDSVDKDEKHDFGDVFGGIISSIPWTMAFLLLILYLFINSNIFVMDVLKPMYPDAIDIDRTNNLGTIISGVVLVLGYIILDILGKCGIV